MIVAMPAYNEGKYIAELVTKAREYAREVIVVDDGSADNTTQQALSAGANVIVHASNLGYGAAIRSLLKAARARNFDSLVIIDADRQHNPEEIPIMAAAIRAGYDLAIGKRDHKDVPVYRNVGGFVLSIFTWILSGKNVLDSQCGFRAYSMRAVARIHPKERGMAISSEIISEATKNRLKITEVPISIQYTNDSSTHNPIAQGFYTLWRVIVMTARRYVNG